MAGIFINYRRDDAPGMAGRLFDHLERHFSRRGLFMDVDAMKPGLDFVKQLDAQVSQCDVLLAIIGQRWLESVDESGGRRLDSSKDYVRIEIASALKRDIPVIPVLVDGAIMPAEDKLPEDLQPLTRRHALELRHTRFNADAEAILSALNAIVPARNMSLVWPLAAAGAAAACIVGGLAVWQFWPPARQPTVVASPPPPMPMQSPESEVARNQAARDAAAQRAEARRRIDEAKSRIEEGKSKSTLSAVPTQPAPAPAARAGAPPRDLRVALGDTMDRVRDTYQIKTDPLSSSSAKGRSLNFNLPLDGIRFFFKDDANNTLENIRVDAPFTGSIEGIHIGDPLENLLARWGQPYTTPWDFGGNKAYAYNIGGRVVRFDIDRSNKVVTIFQFLSKQ